MLTFFISHVTLNTMFGEFNLIEKYFVGRQSRRKDVLLAAGDDCALLKVPEGMSLAVSTDTLVAGTHFLEEANPAWVAHKALAANISDLAAMGATPAWVSLALTLPEPNESWLAPFCDSFFKLADYFDIHLIGGDTTKGPLSLTLTVQGFVDAEKALRRDGARVGDWIYVTGELGDSQAGLDVILNKELRNKPFAEQLEQEHYLSTPRVLAGQALLGIASSAIDISDGLAADLKHILRRSDVGAHLELSEFPVSSQLIQFIGSVDKAQQYALTSGEEYELCFTVPEQYKGAIDATLAHCGCQVSCIGQIRPKGQFLLSNKGQPLDWPQQGFDHFQ